MPLQEGVIVGVQVDGVFGHFIRRHRLGIGEAFSKARAEYFVRDHELVAAHLGVFRIVFRINVDQLHDPVAVRA